LKPGGRIVVSVLGAAPRSRLWRAGWLAGRLARTDWQLAPGDVFVRLPHAGTFRYEHLFSGAEAEQEASAANLNVSIRLEAGSVLVLEPKPPPGSPNVFL
jgi:hypothetical protein